MTLPLFDITDNSLEKLICQRYSERLFKKEKLPLKKIEEILKTALHAPSPSGRNPFYFLIVQNEELLTNLIIKIKEAFSKEIEISKEDKNRYKILEYFERYTLFIKDASILLFCYSNERKNPFSYEISEENKTSSNLISLGAVLQNIGLLCTSHRIGHCIVSGVVELFPHIFENMFDIPSHLKLRCLMALGYPESELPKEIKEINYNRYLRVI